MTEKPKLLAAALAAALVMSATSVSTASAQTQFHSELSETVLTGTQGATPDKPSLTVGSIECATITYKGFVSGKTVTEVTVMPTYGDPHCTVLGLTGRIHVNGCTLRAKIDPENKNVTTGTMDIICPAGKELTATAGGEGTGLILKCMVHVPSQSNLGTATFSNSGTQGHAVFSLSKIKYSHTKGEGIGACPSGSAENGTYTGTALITGESKSGVPTKIFVG